METAKKTGSLIVYDAAYALYIEDDNCPKSIFEIPGEHRSGFNLHLVGTVGQAGSQTDKREKEDLICFFLPVIRQLLLESSVVAFVACRYLD